MSGILAALGLSALEAGKDIGVAAFSNKQIQKREMRNFIDQSRMNNARQDELNLKSANVQMNALKGAGFNPALAFGDGTFNANVNSGSGTTSATNMPDFSILETLSGLANIDNLKEQNKLIKAQEEKTKEEKRAQEIANDNEEQGNYVYNSFVNGKYNSLFKQAFGLYNAVSDAFDLERDDNDPDVLINESIKGNKGSFNAIRDLFGFSGDLASLKNQLGDYSVNYVLNKLRLSDPDYLTSIVNQPKVELERLQKSIDKIISDIDLQNVEKASKQLSMRLASDASVTEFVNKLAGGTADPSDYAKLSALILLGQHGEKINVLDAIGKIKSMLKKDPRKIGTQTERIDENGAYSTTISKDIYQ